MSATTLDSLAKLYCHVWSEDPWNEKWTHKKAIEKIVSNYFTNGAILILALDNKNVCGFIAGKFINLDHIRNRTKHIPDNFPDHLFLVTEVGVSKDYRKQGIGQELFSKLLSSVKATKYILHTRVDADNAKKLYAKIGFVDTKIPDTKNPDHTYWIR